MMQKTLKIDQIKPNPDNPRIIKDDKFKKLVKSLQEFPEMTQIRRVVVNKDLMILGGNMRWRAAKEAGWTDIPVEIVDLPEDKQREFIIKDNVSGGEWDWDTLANEWSKEQLEDWGVDIENWTSDEVVEDDVPDLDDTIKPESKLGEVYQLGRHRLMCGDSTKIEDVEKLMDGKKADMVFTDPPYGVNYTNNKRVNGHEYKRESTYETLENDDLTPYQFKQFMCEVITNMNLVLNDNTVIYLCTSDKPDFRQAYENACKDNGFNYSAYLVWDKGNFGFGFQNYRAEHEGILYYKKGSVEDAWIGGQDKGTIIRITKDANKEYEHPTQKPATLPAHCIKNHKADIILDLFLGSGSTLIACEQTNRTCYGMEIDPKYVDVIRKRYHKFITGSEEGWIEATPVIK